MPENISPDQSVGEHVCDIDCWDNFYVTGDAFADPILGCRSSEPCPGVDHTYTFATLGDVILAARRHCREEHH